LRAQQNRADPARHTRSDDSSLLATSHDGGYNMWIDTELLARRPAWRVAGALLLCAAAAACGGGGGSGGTSMPAPTVSISVAPASITLGQSATLTWSSNTGTTCTASGGWSGTQAASGSTTVTPATSGTATYTLTCAGTGYGSGSTAQSASLAVAGPSAFSNTALDGDTAAAAAANVDANLVNPWGIAFGPTTFAWVANNHTQTSTLYDGNGRAQPAAGPLVVQFAAAASGTTFDPTGIVYNGTADFVVGAAGVSAPARFVFVGEGGMIAGWAPSVDTTHAITVYTDAGGAVYKGLALANDGSGNHLYATDFFNARVDVFDGTFVRQTPTASSFAFSDPAVPAGYAPFGIAALATGTAGAIEIYVTYAQQSAPANHDNTIGAGLGLVDVFDTHGALLRQIVKTGDRLNAPWGLVLAPADYGTLSHALLVGNFGDGRVNGYDPASGAFVGTLGNSAGVAFAAPGLWGIAFGNDADNQPHNTLFYAAGTNNEANGLYGRLDLGATPPVLNQPPVVAITAPTGGASGTVTVTATATDSIAIAKVEIFAGGTSLGVVTSSPYSVQWDTTTLPNASIQLTATATDVDGNVGTSPAVSVLVGNGVTPATLTQIQASVFTPVCSVCHDGSNPASGALPGSQNLTAGKSYGMLVNVASLEQPVLMRVKPNDPAASYLIQKLEGAPGITGVRMPKGGPYLDQATIDQIKSWILNGAPNN
jgi:uncharacterized protein (TIGR03118 family)